VTPSCAREPEILEPEIVSDAMQATVKKTKYLVCPTKHPVGGGVFLGIELPTELVRNRCWQVVQVHPSWLHRDPMG
jgi:hypothetical protein